MSDNNFACIPALGAIPSIKTHFLQRHAKSVLKGCLAADNWLKGLPTIVSHDITFNFSFEKLANQLLAQAIENRQAFKVGYAIRLEQRLLGSAFFAPKGAQS